VLHQEIVEGHIADVEALVNRAFEANLIDAGAYTDAITALAEAELALARIGKVTAERPMQAASQAEGRLYSRWQASAVVREAVRAAVAAMLCLVDGNDARGATTWLNELVRLMPRRRELAPPPQWRRPPLPAAAVASRSTGLAAWRSRPVARPPIVRRHPRHAEAMVA
jgi:hypothetical protein